MRRSKAFTLVELLVVIGIIALLVSILLPSLNKARAQAQQVKCESNLRQVMMATTMYVGESQNFLPFANWGEPKSGAYDFGWLFQTSVASKPPLDSDVETGVLYQYIKNHDIYLCPIQDMQAAQNMNKITSYMMNGSACAFGAQTKPGFKITAIPNGAEKVLYWEGDETASNGFNDGSSDATEETISTRHHKGANVAYLDGHVEWWMQDQFTTAAQYSGRNEVWWNPLTTNGHKP